MTSPQTLHLNGHVDHSEQGNLFYVPFEVPVGTTKIYAVYEYSLKGQGNNLDFGVFGLDTKQNTSQFRGWSGGARDRFTISYEEATPGYLAGPITPGTWHICFGPYRVHEVEGIDWKLTITLKSETDKPLVPFVATPAPTSVLGYKKKSPSDKVESNNWYRGDLHVHSVHSDGQHQPDELIQAAKDRQLDFFFSTEHNTSSAGLVWGRYVPRDFLVGRGEEVTTKYGHWNALGLGVGQWIDARLDDDDALKKAVAQVHDCDGFTIINHPFDIELGCGWAYSFLNEMDAIEVWNGPWKGHEEDYRNIEAVNKWDKFLREGVVFTAVGASDTHALPPNIIGQRLNVAQTVINATDLSVASLIRGMRERKAYIVGEPEYSIGFELHDPDSGQISSIGGLLSATSFNARVSLSGFGTCTLRLLSSSGLVLEENHTSDCNLVFELKSSGMKWIRLEVRDERDHMLGLTNPIWLS